MTCFCRATLISTIYDFFSFILIKIDLNNGTVPRISRVLRGAYSVVCFSNC